MLETSKCPGTIAVQPTVERSRMLQLHNMRLRCKQSFLFILLVVLRRIV